MERSAPTNLDLTTIFRAMLEKFVAETGTSILETITDWNRGWHLALSPDAPELFTLDCIVHIAIIAKSKIGTEVAAYTSFCTLNLILPFARAICGACSPRVAAVLLLQLNTAEDLRGPFRQHATAVTFELANELERVAAAVDPFEALPYWPSHESLVPIDRPYLEAECSNHKASAYQNRGDVKAAQDFYQRAIDTAERSGHQELSATVYSNLATLHQHLAVPELTKSELGYSDLITPMQFDKQRTDSFNQALRCALKSLRINEELRGAMYLRVAYAHSLIADICYSARLRKPCIFHAERARVIYTATQGPEHPRTLQALKQLALYSASVANSCQVELEPDVKAGLKRDAQCARCSGCDRQETEDMRFKHCSRCLVAKFCSRKCMKSAWPEHKEHCTTASGAVAHQTTVFYKTEQRRMMKEERKVQKRLSRKNKNRVV